MKKVAIITDTDSNLPFDIAKKIGIVQVPIIIQFGNESFRDVFDIQNDVLFPRIDKEGKLPTTAAPSPGNFLDAFNSAFKDGAESIFCINISSEMSATYASARQAAEMLPGKHIEVMDSRTLAIGQGFMAIAAAEVAAKGGNLAEVIAAAQSVRSRTHLFGALSSLKYIAMSGRVSHLAAGMAGLLDIKPILTVKDGKLSMLEKIRTQGKSWSRAIELANEQVAGRKIEKMAIMNVNCLENARKFESQLRTSIECPDEILHVNVNPGLSIHTGLGMVAVVFIVAE